ncbi:MAG: NAD-dependent epimerase/dehydratase family protein [Gemmatimonadaceae bacterium]|nr:NAD-dependent epimerase/dehydratase family protein [Gemmatimonadaceae bacterium]
MLRIFMTGATGHVGRAVAEALRDAGHSLTALVRTPQGANEITALGGTPILGTLGDPGTFAATAAGHDALIHTAFEYDASGAESRSTDQIATRALLDVASRSSTVAQVIYTSSAYLLGDLGEAPVDEDIDMAMTSAAGGWRLDLEKEVLARSAGAGFSGAVVRPGLVYGGRGGTMPQWFGDAGRDRLVQYYGAGTNRWTLIYRRDLAALYWRLAESGMGGTFHGVDGTPMPVRAVAEAASRAAGWEGRTRSIPFEELPIAEREHARRALGRDVAVTSSRTSTLGWKPTYPSFQEGAAQAYREWSEA